MVLSGHQPNYLPYPGLIGKILLSDKFIYVSNVQFEKKSWQNRNRIKGANGEIMLTVPTLTKGKYDQKISEVLIDNKNDWKSKHFQAFSLSYKKSRYFNEYYPFLEDLYLKNWDSLMDLDIYIMNYVLKLLECKTQIFYDTDYSFKGNKTDFLVDMTQQLGCDTYLSNKGSASYVDIETFVQAGLNHRYLDYKGIQYRQCFKDFIPFLSVFDMLFNLGTEQTKQVLTDVNNYNFSELNKVIDGGISDEKND